MQLAQLELMAHLVRPACKATPAVRLDLLVHLALLVLVAAIPVQPALLVMMVHLE